jgi:hypothetical protein
MIHLKVGDYYIDNENDVCLVFFVEKGNYGEWLNIQWIHKSTGEFRTSKTKIASYVRMATVAEVMVQRLNGNILRTRDPLTY